MNFLRRVANSDLLANIIDIPDEWKNKKVEIIILPYNNPDDHDPKKNRVKGILAKYKNEELQEKESEAWANIAVEKYENS